MKHGAALHVEWRPRVMRQHEDRHVIRRIVAPPAFPLIVRPRSTHGAKHVTAHDPGAEVFERTHREVVVDACRSAVPPQHRTLKRLGRYEPLVQLLTTAAKRLIEALFNAGAETIGRYSERVHA